MRLARIEISHLGPFEGASLTIPEPSPEQQGEVVLFEGPNGSGKTTIIEAVLGGLARAWKVRRRDDYDDLLAFRERLDSSFLMQWKGDDGLPFSLLCNKPSGLPEEGEGTVENVREIFGFMNLHRFVKSTLVRQAIFSYRGVHPTPSLHPQGPGRFPNLQPQAGALLLGQDETFSSQLGQILTNLEYERTKAIAYALETPEQSEQLRARAASLGGARARIEAALSRMLGREVRFVFDIQRQAPRVLFDGEEMQIEWLGEGLRRTFSWLSDLLARLESIQWEDATRSPHDQDFLLFLDEVDQSLHPTMQMRMVPTLRRLFPRARIYATTHSPFVVASVERGVVFSLRPDPRSHRVTGEIEPRILHGGQTLESIVSEVFDAPATFIDETTRTNLASHKKMVDEMRRGQPVDEQAFLACRRLLWGLGEEVRTILAMREVPVRSRLEPLLRGALREAGE